MKDIFSKIGRYYTNLLKNKRASFYVCMVVCILMIVQTIVYAQIPENIFNGTVITLSIVGIVLGLVFSFSVKQVEILAPISLMVINLLCITAYASADGVIDYFSTAFFSGFSLKTLFSLPVGVYLPIILFVINFIAASVAMYLPQSKKEEAPIAVEGGNN